MESYDIIQFPKGDWGELFRWSSSDATIKQILEEQKDAMTSLNVAYDNDGAWNWGDPEGEGPKVLGLMIDQYADSGAKFIVWGCGNSLAWNFRPKIMELACSKKGFDSGIWELMRSYIEADIDPLTIVLQRAQKRSLRVLAGFRINRYFPHHFPPYSDSWFDKNPQFHLSAASSPQPPTEHINLALPKVREHLVVTHMDVVENYPVDGLHFEFLRGLPFFEFDESNKIEHMNIFLRMLRKELDRVGKRRGKRLWLSLLIPTPEFFRICRPNFPEEMFDLAGQGLDIQTWVNECLVDVMIPTIYEGYRDMEEPASMEQWVSLTQDTGTRLYGYANNLANKISITDCRKRVAIIRDIASNCDGLFLFNTQPLHLAAVLDVAGKHVD